MYLKTLTNHNELSHTEFHSSSAIHCKNPAILMKFMSNYPCRYVMQI